MTCITGVPEPYGVISSTGSSYAWTVDGAVTSPNWTLNSNGTNLAGINWRNPGTYIVNVVETNLTTGCTGVPVSITVTVNPLLTVTVSSSIVCVGNAATITATPGTAGTYNYAWTVPAEATDPGNVATFTSTVAGPYSVVITNSTTTCVSGSATGTVTVNPLPTPDIVGPNPVCESVNNSTEIYNTTNVSGNTYDWTVVGGVFTGQGTNQIVVTWTAPGTGSVSVTEAIGNTGCPATVTQAVNIQGAPSTSNIYHN
jgi:hypothetical protein